MGTLSILLGIVPVLAKYRRSFNIYRNWRWIFWINIPIILIGLIGCLLLKSILQKSTSIHLDIRGNLLLFLSIFCLLISLTSWSYHSILISQYMEIFNLYCCFCLFIMWELKQIILSSIYVYSKICLFVSYICDICFGGTTSLGFIVPPYILEKLIIFHLGK